jgi:hypothetical protein
VPEHMHVHREGLVAQEVIVQRRHLDAARGELCHDRVDLGLGQHEIAHHHALLAHLFEGEPAAKSKPGLQLDPVECDLQIGARQADAVDTARRRRAGLAKCFADLRLPVIGKDGTGRRGHESRSKG